MATQNIVLIGFMGTGKTTVGKQLASTLSMKFLDMDNVIVERTGKSIPDIFAQDGEQHFRALERNLAHELSKQSGLIIATGGGIVLNPANISDLSRTGLVVCLSATPAKILERVATDTNRPLLASGDKMEKIEELLYKRKPLYDSISNQIDTTNLSVEEITENIIRTFENSSV